LTADGLFAEYGRNCKEAIMGMGKVAKRQQRPESVTKKDCTIVGCRRQFTPGVDGYNAKCSMHAHRERRGSKNANAPFRVQGDAGQSETIKVLVSPSLKKHLERTAAAVALGLSGYARRVLAQVSGWKG
jgi:hypothetical protein